MKRKRPSFPRLAPRLQTLTEKNAKESPFEQFKVWFGVAQERNVPQTNAMTLATATPDGIPSARVVLLKGVDDRGFSFFTNFESRKGQQLSVNPHAALLFFWPPLERQVRIEGNVERLSRAESYDYFSSRPRLSRIGAWASRQSEIIEDRKFLERRVKEFQKRFEGTDVPLPEFWGGFRLVPEHFEFWQSRPNRLHDRIVYRKVNDGWKIFRLSP